MLSLEISVRKESGIYIYIYIEYVIFWSSEEKAKLEHTLVAIEM